MKTKIYLVRHTETIGNVECRLTGRLDYDVTEQGKVFIEKLTEKLRSVKFDAAYSSTSERTRKTIQNLADLNSLYIIQDENLCEMYFGIYDGMKWDDVNRINPEIDKLHKATNEIMGIPNQESTEQVSKRMYTCIEKFVNDNLEKTILICSHGVAIEAFLRKVNNVNFDCDIEEYGQKNTSVNILEYDNEKHKFKILVLNDIKHLVE